MRGLIVGVALGMLVPSLVELLGITAVLGLLRALFCVLRGHERNAASADRLARIWGSERLPVTPALFPWYEGLMFTVFCLVAGVATHWLVGP